MTGDRRPGESRDYRLFHRGPDLFRFQVVVQETDLDVAVPVLDFTPDLPGRVAALVSESRGRLEAYIAADPLFASSLLPRRVLPGAPRLAGLMAAAGRRAGVGPMASVAGALAAEVGRAAVRHLRAHGPGAGDEDCTGVEGLAAEIIVENGGDIFLRSDRERVVAVHAGASPLSGRFGLLFTAGRASLGLGICTSSGTVGHSLSLGRADAVTVASASAALADAVATAAGNRVKGRRDLEDAVGYACSVRGVLGAVAVMGDRLAARGRIAIVRVGA